MARFFCVCEIKDTKHPKLTRSTPPDWKHFESPAPQTELSEKD
jgi:hypothetical protein